MKMKELLAIGTIIASRFVTIKAESEGDDDVQKFQPRFRITETKLDRMSEVVVSAGGQLKNWKANPQVFFGHRSWSLPIGMGVPSTVDQNDKFIEVDKIFDDDGTDEFSTLVSLKLQKGFLTRSSIGFMPIEISEEPMFPKQKGVTYLKWELLESSVVPIPALVSAGRVKQDEIKEEFDRFRGLIRDIGHTGIEEDIDWYVNKCHAIPMEEAEFLEIDKKIIVPKAEPEEDPRVVELEKQVATLVETVKNLKTPEPTAKPEEKKEDPPETEPNISENNGSLIHGIQLFDLTTKLIRMRSQLKTVELNTTVIDKDTKV